MTIGGEGKGALIPHNLKQPSWAYRGSLNVEGERVLECRAIIGNRKDLETIGLRIAQTAVDRPRVGTILNLNTTG
jgi:hypothetical protein